jgi:hypothetical protein
MWLFVFGCSVRDVSGDADAFILRANQSNSSLLLGLQDPEDKRITIIRNVGNYTPKDMASHSRRSESSATPL